MSQAPAEGRLELEPATNLDLPQHYLDRELSWLAFNARVLDQAGDPSWPLLERVKFLAIFAANLDEFFMIRVSGLHDQRETELALPASTGSAAAEQLARLRVVVSELCDRAAALFSSELLPELEARGIRLRRYASLDAAERAWARAYFRAQVFPVLTPLAVDPVHPFPFVSNLSLSLAVEAEDPTTGGRHFARVKVPESLERLLAIPAAGQPAPEAEGPLEFLPLEELIAANLGDLFPGMRVVGSWPFRVTRDMDIDILEEEAADLLSVVDREVRKRRFGAPVRLELSPAAPERVRALLLEKLELDLGDLYERSEMLGLSSLFSLARLPRKELRDPPLRQALPYEWDDDDVFARIRQGDILLHHPYESFTPVLDLLRSAAGDPNVLAIKMTLYRAGATSEAVQTLIRAAESGKQVAVSVELKARFDEEANIGWARALERAGAHVFYGTTGLKTHAKALLVVRREADGLRRYVHFSTGNYNASTAKLYTDLGLLSSDEALGEDATALFNTLSGFARNVAYRKLAVAPDTLRPAIIAKIRAQKERARRGEPARIFAKLNSLVDAEIIRELYAASGAGVSVDLLVRGICCLRPGLPGVSENVRVFSLIGRFLEHERVCVFGPPDCAEYYLSSADWMPRNLDRRVELLFPVNDDRLRERLRREVLEPFYADDSRVYAMDSDGNYRRRRPERPEAPVDGQNFAFERVNELVSARAPESSAQPLVLVSG